MSSARCCFLTSVGKDDSTTASISLPRLWGMFSNKQNEHSKPSKHWKTLLGSTVNTEPEQVKGFASGKIL